MAKLLTRQDALNTLRNLPSVVLEAIAFVVETAEVQGDYKFNGEDSVYEDDVAATLNGLASEIRGLKKQGGEDAQRDT